MMNTPEGQQLSKSYNDVIRKATLQWAILEQMKNPAPGFDEIIRTHFKIKKEQVLKTANEWINESR